MAAVCAPVTVITARRNGLPYGTTVSAFASLSLAPPMVVVALDRGSQLLQVIHETGEFGVNVLGREQAGLAANFARKGGSGKFAGVAWRPDSGLPRLPDAGAFVSCRVAQVIEGGDHLLVLADVVAADSTDRAPLTYHRRTFGTHTVLGEAS
ncbi:flavin reductase family protein [Streptomyces sp. 205]|uniref:Flavin reductase family protein n=2 Tax=Streptomyces coffeae TaxID=621382 RepID=A0ABS1NN43_9ACTN|nr:flavin reductase family protein [Streptomyces coffeae]